MENAVQEPRTDIHEAPGGIISSLYTSALADLESAKREYQLQAERKSSIHRTVHAQRIIAELQSSLDRENGGYLALHLSRIYEFMQYRLCEAITEPEKYFHRNIEEVVEILKPLSDAWKSTPKDSFGENMRAHGLPE